MAHSSKEQFTAVQKELDQTLWNLKGTADKEFRVALLRKMRQLLDKADGILEAPATEEGTK